MNTKINEPLMRVLKEKYGSVPLVHQDVNSDEKFRIACKEKVIK